MQRNTSSIQKGVVVKKAIGFFALLSVVLLVSQPAPAQTVSEDYYVGLYSQVKDYHQTIFKLISLRPADKTLKIFALKALEDDFGAYKGIQPPEGLNEMKRRTLRIMKFHMAALQLLIQGKPGAMEYWKKGDAEMEAVEAFLARRRADKAEPPPLDPKFRPVEPQLTAQEYADRYFLIRLVNKEIGSKLLWGMKTPVKFDYAEKVFNTQIKLLKQTKYPPEMADIQTKLLKALGINLEWLAALKQKRVWDAGMKQKEVAAIYTEINKELTQKYNVTIPNNLGLK